MVVSLSKFLSRTIRPSPINRPMLTDIPNFGSVQRASHLYGNNVAQLWRRLTRTPELVATINIPITDIIGDRPEWTDTEGKTLGRNKLLQAKKFWREQRGKETLKAILFDMFYSGDGYLWKGKASKKEVTEAFKECLKKFGINPLQSKEILSSKAIDEDLKKVRKIDYVAASTVRIQHDETEIFGYEQTANGQRAEFSPEEIVHFRYQSANGMVKGFSPAESLIAEILLLQFVKENMLAFMRNGGAPDRVFIMPKEIAQSPNHRYLVQMLKKYKKLQNMHGNLVFTGELDVKDLQGSPKDMEFKELALYITSNIAFAYGIPATRIPYLIGSMATKGDSGGLAESGYWNAISDKQDTVEDLLNDQLFGPMGWHIKLPRKYKQDEVREAQTASMHADTVTKYQSILFKNEKRMTIAKVLNLLKFTKEDIEDIPQESKNFDEREKDNMRNQNMLSNDELNKEEDRQQHSQTRKNVANAKGVGESLHNP